MGISLENKNLKYSEVRLFYPRHSTTLSQSLLPLQIASKALFYPLQRMQVASKSPFSPFAAHASDQPDPFFTLCSACK